MFHTQTSTSRTLTRCAALSLLLPWLILSPVAQVRSAGQTDTRPAGHERLQARSGQDSDPDTVKALLPMPVSWTTGTGRWSGQWGRRETLLCPAGGKPGSAWGTDMYTDDSSVCTAAVHAGLIVSVAGGPVTIEVRPDPSRYLGSTRNGITTEDWIDVWLSSFIFLWGPALSGPAPATYTDGTMIADSWPGPTGRVVTLVCPPRFDLRSVYGTDIYTGDSSICSAGVHAGVITQAAGGMVTIKLLAGQHVYAGSTRNGVPSLSAESRQQSFTFVETPPHTPPPPTVDTPFFPPPGSLPEVASLNRLAGVPETIVCGQHATQFLAFHEAHSSIPCHVHLPVSWIDQDTGVALGP